MKSIGSVIGVVGGDSWRANFGVEAAGSQRHVCIDSTFLFGPSPTLSKDMLTLVLRNSGLLPEQLQPARKA